MVGVRADVVSVSIGKETYRYKPREFRLVRKSLASHSPVAILPQKKGEAPRAGVVVGREGQPGDAEPWSYVVKTESGAEVIPETHIYELEVKVEDPLERLELNEWRGPKRFFARLGLLERSTVWKTDSEGIPALLGSRIDPHFHQFYAARRVLTDREPRFLLADEVGLGKTIEAGLVIQALIAANPDLRVLVVAPGTTSRQWLSELYSRFGGRVFTHLDGVRFENGDEGDTAAQWKMKLPRLLQRDLLIVTTSLLRTRPEARAAIEAQRWDLLVVDEGHHLAWWPELAKSLRGISSRASGCLVLTATPGRGDEKGLLELLRLVAPAVYGDMTLAAFQARLGPQRDILERLNFSEQLLAALLAGGGVGEEHARVLAEDWKGRLPGDAVAEELLCRMEEGDGEAAEQLVAHVQEHYRVDRRIIRTRRRTLGEYGVRHARRVHQPVEYRASPQEVEVVQHVAALCQDRGAPPTARALWARLACTSPRSLAASLEVRLAALERRRRASDLPDPLAMDLGPAEEEAALSAFLEGSPSFPGEEAWASAALELARAWARADGDECARLRGLREWVESAFRDGKKKLLVFTQSREFAEECAATLARGLGREAVALSHHRLAEPDIAAVALRFQRDARCRVLVSDELGAEGRNFQCAEAVIHLDQPWLAERLEQRIGRLDRIGRDASRDVVSVTISGPSEQEAALLQLQRDAFRVYERSIGGLEYLLPSIQERVRVGVGTGAEAVRSLAAALRPELKEEEKQIDHAFAFFLDASRHELDRAKEFADLVCGREGEEDEGLVKAWCHQRDIAVIKQGDETRWKIEVVPDRMKEPLPALGKTDWIRFGTFRRKVALEDESIQYFAPGHLFMDAVLEDARGSHEARAAAFFRDLGSKGARRLFAVLVAKVSIDESVLPERMSPGVRRRVEQFLPDEWVRVPYEIIPAGGFTAVPPGELQEKLKADEGHDHKMGQDHMEAIRSAVPALWADVRKAASDCPARVRAQLARQIEGAVEGLEEELRGEMAFLRTQGKKGASAFREREALLEAVREPAVTIDAVAIVYGEAAR